MKVSVITPTHNPKHLREVHMSLQAQTYKNWEWVICPNNGAQIPLWTEKYDQIKVVPVPSNLEGIGAIKNFAFNQATGDILLEFDHDDLLSSNALERVVSEFERTSADFVYSNFCEFFGRRPHEGNFHFYLDSAKNGWRYRPAGSYSETIAFAPSAASLSLIYYAPNHLRAWRADFYRRVGGHNPSYALCDDHELLIRTYLQGTIHHIDELLYFYRMGEQNTFSKNLDTIRELTWQLHNQYYERLVLREAELRNIPCYDLGGGIGCPPGWISVDLEGGTVTADLTKRWPFEDSSVFAFRAHDIIEHLPDKQHTMSELHRCLVPGGHALISVPSTDGRGAFMDPTHVSFWNSNSFWYYTRPEQAKYIRNDTVHFLEKQLYNHFPTEWHKLHNIPYTVANLICDKGDMSEVPGVRQFLVKV